MSITWRPHQCTDRKPESMHEPFAKSTIIDGNSIPSSKSSSLSFCFQKQMASTARSNTGNKRVLKE
eukprot:15366053-Ditylum_brightwellii.AAC.1